VGLYVFDGAHAEVAENEVLHDPEEDGYVEVGEVADEELEGVHGEAAAVDEEDAHVDLVDEQVVVQRVLHDAPEVDHEHDDVEDQADRDGAVLAELAVQVVDQDYGELAQALEEGEHLEVGRELPLPRDELVVAVAERGQQDEGQLQEQVREGQAVHELADAGLAAVVRHPLRPEALVVGHHDGQARVHQRDEEDPLVQLREVGHRAVHHPLVLLLVPLVVL